MELSIIIPTLNEAPGLSKTLAALENCSAEIIVVDGGSSDGTLKSAHEYTPHVVPSRPGRGVQQDTGARYAHGEVLLFLHADTLLPAGFNYIIKETLSEPGVVFGAFHLSIHPSTPGLKLIALMANLRSWLLHLPYGDQALFMRRRDYVDAGGFRNLPIMEDVDLVRRLKKTGRFKLARGDVKTSARRWKQEGLVYATLRNWSLMIRYLSGSSPRTLLRRYPDAR